MNGSGYKPIGHVTLEAINRTIMLVPYILSQVTAIHLKLPVYFVYGCLIFKWVIMTQIEGRAPG